MIQKKWLKAKAYKMTLNPLIIIPDSGKDLLVEELSFAFNAKGFAVERIKPQELLATESVHYLPELLKKEKKRPVIFFSINFNSLTLKPVNLRILQQEGILCAVWCVDNPWHLLSAVQGPEWKKVFLFVTDKSFIEPLKGAGAEHVFHLPLASDASLMNTKTPKEIPQFMKNISPFVFVGRAAFPAKDVFFNGQSIPDSLRHEALQMLENGKRPDFNWWLDKLDLKSTILWPGKKARQAGFGAEESNLALRSSGLNAVHKCGHGLTVFGFSDTPKYEWKNLVPELNDVRPGLDYYKHTPSVYQQAQFILNFCSLLLPAGLTQRNFDVWSAGGFCLTDRSPGLEIFPEELVNSISFSGVNEICTLAERYMSNKKLKNEIKNAWREEIMERHSFRNRVDYVLEKVL